MENHKFKWVNPLIMVIFNSYFDITRGYPPQFNVTPLCLEGPSKKNPVGRHWSTTFAMHLLNQTLLNAGMEYAPRSRNLIYGGCSMTGVFVLDNLGL